MCRFNTCKGVALSDVNLIQNCAVEFVFECPERWDALTPTNDANVRHCGVCNKSVTFCATPEDISALLDQSPDACVAHPMPQRQHIKGPITGKLLSKQKHPSQSEKLRKFIDSL